MKIKIKEYDEVHAKEIAILFRNTIHKTCNKEYSKQQLEAWAPSDIDFNRWKKKLQKTKPFLAFCANILVGFAEFYDGYIDCFYVHKNYQGQGIGKALLHHIIEIAKVQDIYTIKIDTSITAKAFFQDYGFKVIKKNIVLRNDIELENYSMKLNINKKDNR